MTTDNDFLDELDELAPELGNGEEPEEESDLEEESEVEEEDDGEEEGEDSEEGAESEGGEEDPEDGAAVEELDSDESDELVSEPDVIDPLIAELREQNAKLLELVQKGQVVEPEPEPEPAKKAESIDEMFGDLSFDEIMSDRDLFVGFMQKVMSSATENSVERVATSMPQYVINQVKQQQFLADTTEKFYGANAQLTPHKKVVGMLTNEIIAEHQDWPLDKVLEETAERSYKLLNMKKQAIVADTSTGPKPRNSPALNKKVRSGKRKAPKLSKLQNEINDLL